MNIEVIQLGFTLGKYTLNEVEKEPVELIYKKDLLPSRTGSTLGSI